MLFQTICQIPRKKGYLILGAYDNGTLSGLRVDDALMKRIAGIRSDGNILPLPIMSVERFELEGGDLLVVEVSPALVPPVSISWSYLYSYRTSSGHCNRVRRKSPFGEENILYGYF